MGRQFLKEGNPRGHRPNNYTVVVLMLTCVLILSWIIIALQLNQQTLNCHLISSIRHSDAVAVQRLLIEGADPNSKDCQDGPDINSPSLRISHMIDMWWHHKQLGDQALIVALETYAKEGVFPHEFTSEQLSVVELLLKKGAYANCRNQDGRTLLSLAVACRDIRVVQLLLRYSADVNLADYLTGNTPLMTANNECACELFLHGAQCNTRNLSGETPLMNACISGDNCLVRTLIDRGAYINARNHAGYSSLMLATGSGQLSTLKILLEHGTNLDLVNENRYTALMIAVEIGDPDKAALLMQAGANSKLRNYQGDSAMSIAKQGYACKWFHRMIKALSIRGPKVDHHLF